MRKTYIKSGFWCALVTSFLAFNLQAQSDSRPNILFMMVDDMGYTDIGVYGSEINTPNLDQLANDGLLLTNFYNEAVCSTTRAAVLGGTDNHIAGGGFSQHQTPNQQGQPGYEPYLNEAVAPFSATLQTAGYNTYYAGKWHLGTQPHQRPNARGFDRSFALLSGMSSHYNDMSFVALDRKSPYAVDGVDIDSLPEDFYSTTFYTDYIIESIEKDSETGDPWFAYLSYTAPHWPLQAPDEYIAKYEGMYDHGYEVQREIRTEKGIELGIFPEGTESYRRLAIVDPWDSLTAEEQAISVKKMEIHAAMLDLLDENVGRLIDYLKETDQYDNTLIMFISDNGAEGQARNPAGANDGGFDNSYENMGRQFSFHHIGAEWAAVGGGPLRYFKSMSSEGGIRGPAIIHYPQSDSRGVISDAFTTVVDIAATFIDLADANHPEFGFNGHPIEPLGGESMVPLIMGDSDQVHADDYVFAWEVFGHLAVRKGDWKLLQLANPATDRGQRPAEEAGFWGLYNISVDPGETNDLAAEHPEKVEELLAAWEVYVAEHQIIIPIIEEQAGGAGGMGAGGMGAGMGAGG